MGCQAEGRRCFSQRGKLIFFIYLMFFINFQLNYRLIFQVYQAVCYGNVYGFHQQLEEGERDNQSDILVKTCLRQVFGSNGQRTQRETLFRQPAHKTRTKVS